MTEALALHGGRPVRPALLPYGRHWVDDGDVAAVVESLRSGWVTTGPPIARFERAVAAQVGAARGVAVSSGTAALHAAMFAAGVGPGDEVIAPPLTFAATTNAVLYQGGVPVFADVRADTLTLDPAEVERRLTPRTKAVVVVDYAGQPGDLDALRDLTRRRGVALVEDAAHA
ncbi:MAG: DegT/DnrJ/EryC1/StrS family aminotransferase, partial [Candidatus Rokuibacteriota bacterium]